MINEQTKEAQDAPATHLLPDKDRIGSGLEDDRLVPQLDDITSAAAKAARDYQSRTLENIKVNINAALNYANGLASASLSPDFTGEAAEQLREQEKDSDTPKQEQQPLAQLKAAKEYRAEAFELMTANVNATLDYVQRLANVRSLPEFIELSTDHARKHFELIMKQTAALGALSQSLTASNAERMTASIANTLSRKKA